MKKAVLAMAAAAMLSFGVSAPAPAFAQGWYDDAPPPPRPYGHERGYERRDRDWGRDRDRRFREDVMGPRQIARMLERRGYDVGDIDMRRGSYFVKASRHGRRVILIVDARSGRILDEQRVVGGGRPHRTGFTIEVNP